MSKRDLIKEKALELAGAIREEVDRVDQAGAEVDEHSESLKTTVELLAARTETRLKLLENRYKSGPSKGGRKKRKT